jgi:RNA polymerase sigma-70 factor (ECF subfamily)
LLERTRAQDQAAWERLVTLYSPLVYRWCRQAGLQPADAADVGQEVFRAVARKIGDFRRDRPGDSFRGWLRVITQNKLRDHERKQAKEGGGVGGSDALRKLQQVPAQPRDSPEPASDADEERIVYRQALELIRAEFEERTWQAFSRVVMDGVRPADVAAELGLTVNAVYLARSRVLRRIREEFADLVDTRPR